MTEALIVPTFEHEATPWMMVGERPIVLNEVYDMDQLWLPFATRIMFRGEDQADRGSRISSEENEWYREYNLRQIRLRQKGGIDGLSVSATSPRFPPPQKDIPQYVLPFEEYRNLIGDRMVEIRRADYPTFDRNDDGDLFEIDREKPRSSISDAIDWCLENLGGRFYVGSYNLLVERQEDFMIARLRF